MLTKPSYYFRLLLLLFLAYHFFLESNPKQAAPNLKLYELLSLQRQIDTYTPLSQNNLQGTHNSFNSDVYHTLFRYHDRQQHLSLEDQLNYGARFLELDVHWTFSIFTMKQDLLLCHGSDRFNFFPFHWGCSPFDKPLDEGLAEVSGWLKNPLNKNEVLIFYIEDHSDEHYEYLYNLLEKYGIAQAMFESGGCKAIPDTLTKDEIISQGKQIIFWKDGECANFAPLANLAFSDLGNLQRFAEDRTLLGTFEKRYVRGVNPHIERPDIINSFQRGDNIVNLDNFSINDERLSAVLWSWELFDSDIELHQVTDGCAQQQENSFWKIEVCDSELLQAACFNIVQQKWLLTETDVNWQEAENACQKQQGFVFSAPTNYQENQALNSLKKNSSKNIWLNIKKHKEIIIVGDKRQHH